MHRTTHIASLLALGLVLSAGPALAQTMTAPPSAPAPVNTPAGTPAGPDNTATIASPPVGERGAGIDSANAVNPAPGASGPYVGHGEAAFYDVEQRIGKVEERARSQLTGAVQRRAMSDIRSIRAELATQKARHGEVRDWDREHLNQRLDQLEARFGLGGAVASVR